MKVLPLPAEREQQQKKCAALHRTGVFYNVCIIGFAVLAVALLLGMFVTVIVFEFKGGLEASRLACILVGALAGGAIVLALAAFGLNVLARAHRDTELDFRERCDGEESFFVGDGTLATFEEKGLRIHGEKASNGRDVFVPYGEMRVFSVCTRRAPKEKGEWSVVFEVPSHYLSKKDEDGPALIQTDAKPRLDDTLARHDLAVLGEKRGNGVGKFTLRAKFLLPHRAKRRAALFTGGLGAVLVVGGVLCGFFVQVAIGVILGVVGCMLAARAVFSYLRAKGVFGVYDEGIYWKDSGRVDSIFLKWEEIVHIERFEKNGADLLRVSCAYGAYHFPCIGDAETYLREKVPEKFDERA